jgi:hypothetical protein
MQANDAWKNAEIPLSIGPGVGDVNGPCVECVHFHAKPTVKGILNSKKNVVTCYYLGGDNCVRIRLCEIFLDC